MLILTAAVVFLHDAGLLSLSGKAVGGTVVVLVALGLVFGPWFVRLARNLASERSERIRSQERAELAAHLHDSWTEPCAWSRSGSRR